MDINVAMGFSFSDLLDEYIDRRLEYEYLDHPNCDRMTDSERDNVKRRYFSARDNLNEFVDILRPPPDNIYP